MQRYIDSNRSKIKKFDYGYFLSRKNYALASAISALDTTNQIAISYYREDALLSSEDHTLRLYALLQGLFVSIDALYSLAYELTGSKSFININNNPHMRELKFIRNDVVGHPTNRIYSHDKKSYCILDTKTITKRSFSYTIYNSDNQETRRSVDIDDLLIAYYKEANNLLDSLANISRKHIDGSILKDYIKEACDNYKKNGHFIDAFNNFIDKYKELYPNARKDLHRIVWRYELTMNLVSISNDNKDIKDLVFYSIGLELNKIFRLIWHKDYPHKDSFELPSMVLSIYRFLNRNNAYIEYIHNLKDISNPLYYDSLKKLYEGVSLKKMQGAMDYLGFIITLYQGGQLDLVYAISLPIFEYKLK